MALNLVFMGTPEFAVASLEAVVAAGHRVLAVITAPDKPAGRGQKLQASEVKQAAERLSLPVWQPEKLKDPDFQARLKALNADLFVVVAFRMLPEAVWSMPPLGTLNVHASLLPAYRGAAPIHWAVMNGETQTGVTTFRLKHEIDTGDILLQAPEPIHPEDTTGSLYQRLMQRGAGLLVQTLAGLESGTIVPKPQIFTADQPHAPKIFRADCELDFQQPAEVLRNKIRGLNPFPTAWAELKGKPYKIHAAEVLAHSTLAPGELDTDHKSYLTIGCGQHALALLDFQAEGKKRMSPAEFFRGNTL